MFVLIEDVTKRERKEKISIIKKDKAPTVKCIRLKNRRCFYKIEAEEKRGLLPWEEIERLCGTLSKKAVLPKNIKGKETTKIKPYESQMFLEKALLRMSCEILKEKRAQNLSITLFDKKGILQKETEGLVPFSRSLCVVTDKAQNYEKAQQQLIMKYGLSLKVRHDGENAACLSDVLIAPYDFPISFSETLFTLKKGRSLAKKIYVLKDISLPTFYNEILGENTDRLLFASALYEICDIKEMLCEKVIYERY